MASGMLARTREETSDEWHAPTAHLVRDIGPVARTVAFPARPPVIVGEPGLRGFVERAIVPRLHRAFEGRLAESGVPAVACLAGHHAAQEDFVDLLLHADVDGVCDAIARLHAAGMTLDRIYIEHLAPAAVRLNQISAEGLCTSTEAALAFCNLQIVLRRHADLFCAEACQDYRGLRALLVSAASDRSHDAGLQVFGLVLAAEFFRRDGWDVWVERGVASEPFKDVVRTQWFDMVEVIATDEGTLDAIASGIRLIRRVAPNPGAAIIACGRVFEERPEYVRQVGADRFAADALASVPQARTLVTQVKRRQQLP